MNNNNFAPIKLSKINFFVCGEKHKFIEWGLHGNRSYKNINAYILWIKFLPEAWISSLKPLSQKNIPQGGLYDLILLKWNVSSMILYMK